MRGLTEDQKDNLRHMIMDSDMWSAVIAVAELSLKRHESAVLECDISKSRELLIKRANLDGARAVVRTLTSLKDEFKTKK